MPIFARVRGVFLACLGPAVLLIACDDGGSSGSPSAAGGGTAVLPPAAGGGGGAAPIDPGAGGSTAGAASPGAGGVVTVLLNGSAGLMESGTSGPACAAQTSYQGNASLTWYTLSQGSDEVNCSYPITARGPELVGYVNTGAGQYFAALNTADYNGSMACGACVEVTRDTGAKVVVTIVDQCPTATNPKCTAGHIDLSKPAFLNIGTEVEGYLGQGNGAATGVISFRFVPCPVQGNVVVRLKEPANIYWNELLIMNHRTPIALVEAEVNGSYLPGTRQSYNYWNINGGNLRLPLNVRITDVNGSSIVANLAAGVLDQDTGQQFPDCIP